MTEETMATIFDALCPTCAEVLEPVAGARWQCRACGSTLERCGTFVVEGRRDGDDATPDDTSGDQRSLREDPLAAN